MYISKPLNWKTVIHVVDFCILFLQEKLVAHIL